MSIILNSLEFNTLFHKVDKNQSVCALLSTQFTWDKTFLFYVI